MQYSRRLTIVAACLLTCSCAPQGSTTDGQSASVQSATPVAADPLVTASKHYYDYVLAKDLDGVGKIEGSQGLTCSQDGDTAKVGLPKALFDTYALSVINPDGGNYQLHFDPTSPDKLLAKGLDIAVTGDQVSVAVHKSTTLDTCGVDETGSGCVKRPVWSKPGKYVFIVTKFLPYWYEDYAEIPSQDDYMFAAYCTIELT